MRVSRRRPTSGAVGSFLWFATQEEMFECLAGPEIDLLQFDDGDASRMAVSVRRVLRDVGSVARVDRGRLSACFEGWAEIVWLSRFAELCERGGSFPTGLHASFRRANGGGDHAAPIADDELDGSVAGPGS